MYSTAFIPCLNVGSLFYCVPNISVMKGLVSSSTWHTSAVCYSVFRSWVSCLCFTPLVSLNGSSISFILMWHHAVTSVCRIYCHHVFLVCLHAGVKKLTFPRAAPAHQSQVFPGSPLERVCQALVSSRPPSAGPCVSQLLELSMFVSSHHP